MKLIYKDMEHIIQLGDGYASELIVENKKLFFEMVNSLSLQAEGAAGNFVLSINDKPVELSKYSDVIVQFAPFQLNKKSLLTKLYASLEQRATNAENYIKTLDLLGKLEAYIFSLSEELPFEIDCKKIAIGPIIRALSPEIEESDKTTLEKIFAYMELIRELDKERFFAMVNMRTYFSDDEMEKFVESAVFHDFKVLFLENMTFPLLKNTKRYIIDEDLCEF